MRAPLLTLLFVSGLCLTYPAYAVANQDSADTLIGASSESTLPPADDTQQQPDRFSGTYLRSCLTDAGNIVSSPLRWDSGDWLTTGLVAGVTAGLYLAADTDIRNATQRNQSSTADHFATIGNALGNPLYTLPPLGLMYLYGDAMDNAHTRQTALLAGESLAISGVFALSIKITAQRSRPYTGKGPDAWHGPRGTTGDYSFPSGHTQSAFSVATVIAEQYSNEPLIPPLAYGLASLTGLARIYDDKHWASDVFFGGAIGYFVGRAVVSYHSHAQTNSRLLLIPTISKDSLMLTASYRF